VPAVRGRASDPAHPELEAQPLSPDVNWYAHASGIAEGTFKHQLLNRLRLCTKHRQPR
jgi:hypothetical protein